MKNSISAIVKNYHVGCGLTLSGCYLNIDAAFAFEKNISIDENKIYKINSDKNSYIFKFDLRNGLPASKNSLEVIYHCHFLEHLTHRDGVRFLAQCYDALKPGGLMRIVVPDLRLWCKNYISENQSFFDWYRETYLGDNKKFYSTNAAIFMGMLHNHQHKMAYDAETLSQILEEIGFHVENSNCEWGIGSIPDLQFLEQKDNPRKFESLIFECVKKK